MSKPVVLTGLRANSEFHIGNYLGGILPMVKLQAQHSGKYQLNMFIPDLHSFTTPIDHGKLYQNTIDNLKVFVAAGLSINDPNTYIYRQSYIPAHSELAWILNCFAYMGELSRMTQFKEKTKGTDIDLSNETGSFEGYPHVSAGLFNYPVLMAADILLYGAEWVPLGADQQQHLELARDLAIRMNNKFGEIFVVPHEWRKQLEFTNRENVRVRSLRNPGKKMSKSVEDPAGTVLLTDKPDEAVKKIMSATTDGLNRLPDGPTERSEQPGVANLMLIKALLTGNMNLPEGNTQGYAYLKRQVAKDVSDFLMDFQSKLAEVNEAKLMAKLEADEAAMNKVANATLFKVQKAVGLRPS